MKVYVMDAFSDRMFGGNQAGVALPEGELADETMRGAEAFGNGVCLAKARWGKAEILYSCWGGGSVRPCNSGLFCAAAKAGKN